MFRSTFDAKRNPDGSRRRPAIRPNDRPRGHRFGAGVSALLLASFLFSQPLGVAIVLLSIGSSGLFGLRYTLYGAVWRRIVKIARLGPTEPEHEYPPRFARVLGSIALVLSLIGFAIGLPVVGWVFAGAVAALQTLLATTGYCLGCRLYFLRWWVPGQVTRLWARRAASSRTPLRYS